MHLYSFSCLKSETERGLVGCSFSCVCNWLYTCLYLHTGALKLSLSQCLLTISYCHNIIYSIARTRFCRHSAEIISIVIVSTLTYTHLASHCIKTVLSTHLFKTYSLLLEIPQQSMTPSESRYCSLMLFPI